MNVYVFVILYTYLENGKAAKKVRIPKGFFSSNTAYMLVYKRTSNHVDSSKKSIVKKLNHSALNHIVDLQNPSVTLIRDSVNVGNIKGKRFLKEKSTDEIQVLEKKLKFENEDSKNDSRYNNKENANGSHSFNGESDNENKHEIVEAVKESKEKLDFKTMSCGQRDAYENVCIKMFFSLLQYN